MLNFKEYCDIIDELSIAEIAETIDEPINKVNYIEKNKYQLLWCAAINDLQEDEVFFETIINQSDLDTLYKLQEYFHEETRLGHTIADRIYRLQQFGNSFLPEKKKTMPKDDDFYSYLCGWMDMKGFQSDADFYNHAGISRQVFSKLRNNKSPVTREMALHLAVALELNYEECEKFLRHAGYSLNPMNRRDRIIALLMRKRKYRFYEMEELLSVLHEKTFLEWE